MSSRTAFTLIELLVVIAIMAVLAVVVVLTLNPAGLLQESRDSNRLSDMATLNSAIGISLADSPLESLGSSSVLYVSIPDPSATSTLGDQCQGLGLPALPAGWIYDCSSSGTARKTDDTGWVPVNLGQNAFGSSLAQLPLDPINATSSGFYYTYVTNGSQFEVASLFESQKYKTQFGQSPLVPGYPEVNAKGSNLSLSPLWSPSGLVGYWPMDEGNGTVAGDLSGNGNTGTTSGMVSWITGKIGLGIQTTFGNIQISDSPSLRPASNFTLMAWINIPYLTQSSYPAYVIKLNSVSSSNVSYDLDLNPSEQFRSRVDTNISLNNVAQTSVMSDDGLWHQVALVYNGSTAMTYVDGISKSSIPVSGTVIYDNGSLRIGAMGYVTDIDDVRIYSRALSAAEVQALYNAEK
jgi:prepilin-type N-terminal cleavage/methylation domain-containing protein